MKKYILLLIIAISVHPALCGQSFLTENDTHIYWQSNRKLQASDFKGNCNAEEHFKAKCKKYNMCTMVYIGVFSILDIPKKKKDMGKLFEKAYFEKGTSYMFDINDSLGIKKQQILFDIYELSARQARKEIKHIYDSAGSLYGTTHLLYKRVKEDCEKRRNTLSYFYNDEVYTNNLEGAYEKWRKDIDKMLEELEEYTTTPEDCYRFIMKEPIDKKYKQAEYIY